MIYWIEGGFKVILKTNKQQLAAMVLHMSIMRKNVKKGLKNNYGSKEGKELTKVFDEIREQLQDALLTLEITPEEDTQETILLFEEKELTLIHSFLSWYVTEIEVTYEVAGKHLNQEEKEQINSLKDFNKQIESIKGHE